MDDLAQLPAAQLSALPPLEGFSDGAEGATQLLFMCSLCVLTEETLDPLGCLCHTLSL
jgi:hypothetical protein